MSGNPHPVIAENRDGSVNINYKPQDQGTHELSLTYNEKQLEGTPFRCHVDKVGNGFITAYGQGLEQGAAGNTTNFTVVSGTSDAEVTIEGTTKAQVTKKEKKDNHTYYEWLPPLPGAYNVSIKSGGKHIHGSPFTVKVSGEGRKRSQLALTATSEVPLGGTNVDLTNLTGTIKSPSGSTEAAIFKRLFDGRLALSSFAPKEKGTYVVDVKQEGNSFSGSPFKINVTEDKLACAARVHVSGDGLKHAEANKENKFQLNVGSGGYGPLSLSIEGAHRNDISSMEIEKGQYEISYKPHEPGIYVMNIRFADDHIPGSPFMLNVGGKPSGRVRETATAEITPVGDCPPGTKCDIQLKIHGTEPLDMEAFMTDPDGETEPIEIMDQSDFIYDIKFTPKKDGIHIISLKYKGLHISGSPFQWTVGKAPSYGPHKVEIGGPGLEQGEVGAKNEFNVFTREAGGGVLTAAIEGPSKATVKITDSGKGFQIVSYQVDKEGEYGIHVKFNDEHVPGSPHKAIVTPASSDAKKVTLHGIKDRGQETNKPVIFTVNMNGAKGQLKAHVDTPSGYEDEVFLEDLDTQLYSLRFMPKENGVFYVTVKLMETHVPGSPFPILIGKLHHDPELVLQSGDGLEKGATGSPAKFIVNTTKVGAAGVLNVTIEGPSKVAITCQDVDEGYQFSYTPRAPGDYFISTKYGNTHIPGSPSKAVVTGSGKASTITEKSTIVVETVEKTGTKKTRFSGDASKVITKGTGLSRAMMGRMSNFTLDVAKAGHGILTMGILGPKGMPVDEINVKKLKVGVYQVNYKTGEKGDHKLSVKWGGEDIPGSPFTVKG